LPGIEGWTTLPGAVSAGRPRGYVADSSYVSPISEASLSNEPLPPGGFAIVKPEPRDGGSRRCQHCNRRKKRTKRNKNIKV